MNYLTSKECKGYHSGLTPLLIQSSLVKEGGQGGESGELCVNIISAVIFNHDNPDQIKYFR